MTILYFNIICKENSIFSFMSLTKLHLYDDLNISNDTKSIIDHIYDKYSSVMVSWCLCTIDNTTLNIDDLYTPKNYRGNKYSLKLLKKLISRIIELYPHLVNVKCDDACDMIYDKNIYYKLGFKVRDYKTNNWIPIDDWSTLYYPLITNPSEERFITLTELHDNLERL